ncbi:cell cycle checkpoint protein RAD17 [Episyrphus balteatus]|uniref:cell cycle checkpoint protein RAD17 n=1 Tax=Episyrphus balteatus TaxID=286459 RepID=UPI0024852024|nr:cell cycle checkpoint protein RAD17 [Episyrphus balteatus]
MSTKRPKWVKSVFSEDLSSSTDSENPPKKTRSSSSLSNESTSFNFKTPSANDSAISNKESNKIESLVQSANWIECFEPKTIDDLAVHAKKIQEVQDWMQHCDIMKKKKFPAQICLITGPAGSGKTATIKVLAKIMRYQVVEWINPIDSDNITTLGDQVDSYAQSQVELFKSFLFRSSRYKSVLDSCEKRLILVEDFPNCFIKDSTGFNDVLEDYLKYGKSALVFVVTDSKSKKLNISYNLFSDAVKAQFHINHISFNPVSTTLMKKALKRICTLMGGESFRKLYRVPSVDLVDSIGMAAQGDMRNALINLHFGSLKGAPNLKTDTLKTSSQSKTKSKTQKKLSSVGRDETITLMHALGRVFNPKYIDGTKQLLHSPEDIASAFSTEPKSFTNFVHTNYLGHFADIENVLAASDALSISDNVLSEYREDTLGLVGLNIAIRGVMVSNEKPVTGWMPVRGPKRIEIEKSAELNSLGLDQIISAQLLASDYRSYVRIILNKK